MKTKRIIAVCLFLLVACSGFCLARTDSVFYRNAEGVYWADPTTIEHIDGSVYEIWVTVEYTDESQPTVILVEHMDINSRTYSRQRRFYWDGPNEVAMPLEDMGKWHDIKPGTMAEALYDFLYGCLRRKGKI